MFMRDRMAVEDRSLVHTTEALGENQHITPEGFLLCKDVPIARTGIQEYLNDEICEEDDHDNELYGARGKNGIVQVERPEEEVFRPETIASFEGKDVVDDHPDDPVTPDNYHEHTVGVVLNPRRGEGTMSNFMLGDLLIKKASAIAAVRAGKREVSGGYDADYEVLGPGRARQHNIIGNHVALVDRGRCGFRCAIGDKEPDMTKTKAKDGRTLVQRVMDAVKKNPKALDEALKEMEEREEDEAPDAPALEATGTHIHLHLGGEEEAKGSDPATAGEADEGETEEGEGEKDPAAGANANTEKRLMALEAGMNQLAEAMRKLLARVGGGEAESEEDADMEEGEEEAEGDDPEMDEAEVEKEPKEKDKKKDKMGFTPLKDKGKDKAKDAQTVRDSAHLKDDFTDAKSGAEILAPGLKMPTFDAKANAKITRDSICLLKRRALAAAQRDEKNGGAKSVETMLGKKPLAGLDCAMVDTVFNGAVALMQDRNMQDDTPRTVSEARGIKAKDAAKGPTSVRDLNTMNRQHFKQPKLS